MKKFYQITLTVLFVFAGINSFAQSGIYESYAILSINGGANAYYDMQATTGNPDFQGANLGSFNASNSLTLKGGENKTFKCSPCDITNGSLWYRVYPTSTPSGSFNQISYFFGANLGTGCGGNDQRWDATGSSVNLLSGLSPGNYTLEVYSTADYQGCGTGTHYSSNSGSNYKATFNYCGPSTGALPAGSYAIPGCFATVNAAATYITANGVSGAVIFNVAAGHTETAPVRGIQLGTITGSSATNTVKFQKSGSGANPTITAFTPQTSGAKMDAVIRFVGADFVTFDGFTLQENASNSTIAAATNNMTEFGVGFFGASATNGSQNNTIQNCTISMGSTYPSATGIFSTSTLSTADVGTTAQAASSAAGLHSNNKFYSNTISNVNYGFIIICPTQTSALQESGNEIGGSTAALGNTITYGLATGVGQTAAWTGVGSGVNGVMLNTVSGISIQNNTFISSLTSNTATDHTAILFRGTVPSSGTYTRTVSSNTITLGNANTTAVSTGVDFGNGISTGTITCNSNTIVINKSAIAANSAAARGIIATYTAASSSINSNTITINHSVAATAAVAHSSALTGITLPSGTTGTPTNTATGNTITFNRTASNTTGTATVSGAIVGISATTATSVLQIGNAGSGNGNTITVKEAAATGAGTTSYTSAVTYVDLGSAAHGTANVVNNTFNTTGSTIRSTGNLDVIKGGSSTMATLMNIKSNTANIDRVATGTGLINFFNQSSTTPSTPADTVSSNTVTFTNLAGSGAVTLIQEAGGPSSPASLNKSFCNNIFNVSGTHTGTVTCVAPGYCQGANIRGNSFTISTASPTIIGISTITGYQTVSTAAATISGNSFSFASSAASGTELTAIKLSVGTNTNVFSNTISNMSFSAAATSSPQINGIWVSAGSNNIYQNTISGLSHTGTSGGPSMRGIYVSAGTTNVIYKNKVYGLSSVSTGNTALYAIALTGGTTNTIYNNLVSGLSMTTGINSNATPMSGIFASGGTTNNIYHNTVYLSGTTSGSIFYSAGLYTSTTSTTVDVRNNIIVNECSPVGAGTKAAAFYRSGTATTNIAATSNKNFYYAGTPSAANCIYFDVTNTDQTIADYKTRVSPKENGSFTESFTTASYFTSLVGSNAGFLHIPNGITTQLESGGSAIPAVTDDFDGQTRPAGTGTAPDVGACEFNGTSPTPVLTFNSLSPAGNQCSATAHTVSVDATTPAGTITGVTITYNNGSATGPVAMTNTTGNTWTFAIPAASPANTSVTYSVVATNSAGISATYNGVAYADAPYLAVVATATATPSAICLGASSSLSVATTIPGTIDVGTSTTLTSATAQPTAFCNRFAGHRSQVIFTASELTALGLAPGNITSMAYNITTLGDAATNNNFTVKIGNTALSTFASAVFESTTGFTTCFPAATYTHSASGWQTINFSTPFNWNGTSNIIVDVQMDGANLTNNSRTYYTATTGNTVLYTTNSLTATVTLSTTRLNIRFAGNTTLTPTAFSWSNGTSIVGTTNPLSQSPTSNTTYTCTATLGGCPLVSNGAAVTVNSLPAAPSANVATSTQCGSGVPTVSVSGTAAQMRWYDGNTAGAALLQTGGLTYSTSIATTTTFYVGVNDGTCETAPGSRTALTVTVSSADVITASSTQVGSLCLGSSFDLSVNQTGATNTYALTWQAAGAGSGLTASTAGALSPSTLSVTPTAAGTFTYTIDGSEASTGCSSSSSVNVTVINPNAGVTATATASPSTICSGSTTSLSVDVLKTATVSVGAGGTTGTAAPYNPFNGGYGGLKGNYLLRASELTAAGLTAGNITAIALDFSAVGTTYNGFGISMGHTALTVLTNGTIQTGLTSVYSATSVTPTVGVNTYTLNTPFNWDGTSNIIIATCWSNNNASNTSATIRYDNAGFISSVTYRKDNETSANMCSFTGSTGSGTSTFDNSGNRPKFVITGNSASAPSAYSWSNGSTIVGTTNPLSQSPTSNTTYTCTATVGGCPLVSNGAAVTVNSLPAAPSANVATSTQCGSGVPAVSVSGTAGEMRWYNGNTAGATLLQTGGLTYTTSISSTTTFYVGVNNGTCETAPANRTPLTVTVTTPDAITASTTQVGSLCLGSSFDLSVSQTGSTNTYALTWQAAGAGSGLTTNTAGTLSPSILSITPTAAGTFTYTVNGSETSTGCVSSSFVNVTVINPTAGMTANATYSPSSFCLGSSVSLNLTIGNPTLPSGYCSIAAGTNSSSYFNSFTTTGATTNISNTGSGYSTNGYGNFTSQKVVADRNTNITFNTSLIGTTVGVALWVDWNQNGTFETSERMYQSATYTSTATSTFAVPATANYGITRMRVLMDFNTPSPSNPCGPFASGRGEVEDYTFEVAPPSITYSWSDGSSVIGTSNPITVIPVAGTTNYSCTATIGGCPLVSNTLPVAANTTSLGGTYTVGVGGNYTTLTDAVSAWNNACTITGPVIFSLIDATYPSETFPITINDQPLSSSIKTLTIKPASGVNATITGSNNEAILKLNGADNVTLDGSNAASTTRNLSITNNSTSLSSAVVWIASTTANASSNNTVKNAILTGQNANTTFAVILTSGSVIGNNAEVPNNNNTISNNLITNGYYGIGLAGNSSYDVGSVITNNFIGSTSAATIGLNGIFVSNQQNVTISGNTVVGINNTGNIPLGGVYLAGAIDGCTISKNSISNIKNTTAGGRPSNGLWIAQSNASASIVISNNSIYDIANSSNNATLSRGSFGISLASGGGYSLYHNTVSINTEPTAANTLGYNAALYVGTAVTGLDIKNNIFDIRQTTAANRFAVYSDAPNSAYNSINNNVYNSTGTNFGFLGAGQSTLAGWQAATGQDAASLNVAPVFISATNLHLNTSSNPTLDGAGATGTGVTDDIDGDVRCPGGSCPGAGTNPDPGADEFEVPSCLSPSAITTANITSTGVDISWTAPATAPSVGYEWIIVASGAGSAGTPIATTPAAGSVAGTSLIGITGLTASTAYDIWVRSDCGSGIYSPYVGPITFTTRPANDQCSGAVALGVNSSTTCTLTTSGTSSNASQSLVACTGSGTADDDVWYSFVALGAGHSVTVTPGTMNNANFEVFSGSCGSLVSLACVNNTTGVSSETTTLSGLTAGTTYYVRVYSNGNGTGQGTFTVCVTGPPSNDDCANATSLPCGTSSLAGSTIGTIAETAPFGCASNYGVWYSFTGDGSPATVTVLPSGFDVEISVGSGTCGSLTQVSCTDANGSGVAETTTFATINGTTYYVYVAHWSTTSTTTGNFTITRGSALTLSNTGAPVAGNIPVSTIDAVIGGYQLAPSCVSFGQTAVTFTTSGTATTADLSNFRVYRDVNNNGSYESATDILASASALPLSASLVFTLTGQTGISASTRYLLVADVAAGATIGRTITASITTSANVTVSSTPSTTLTGTATGNTQTISSLAPANDLCSNAISLPCGTSALAGTTVDAVAETAPFGCASGLGVWYTFTGDGSSTTLSMTPTGFDGEMTIGSGSCGSLTQVACVNNSLTSGGVENYSFNTVNGTVYYVYVSHATTTSSVTGPFTISRVSALTLSNTGAVAAGTVAQGATNVLISGFQLAPSCASYDLSGLTYTTTGTATTADLSNFRIFRDINSNGTFESGTDVLVSAAAQALSASMVFTITGQTGVSQAGRYLLVADVAAGATIGRTVVASISSVSNITYSTTPLVTATGTATGNTRTITGVPPANDNCATATAFPTIPTTGVCVTLSGQTTAYATASNVTPTGACASNSGSPDDDVWYSFVAPGPVVNLNFTYVSGLTDIYWQAFSSACGSTMTSIACSDANAGGTLSGLTVGNTYYIRMYTWAATGLSVQDICLQTPPPPPSNDNCVTATVFPTIPTDGTCAVLNNQTTGGGTNSNVTPTGSCNSNSGNPDDDVWYSFVPTSTTQIIQFTYVTGVTDIYWQVFSGSCGSTMTSIACSDANAGGILSGLTVGQTYYLRLYTWGAGVQSTQNICIKATLPNDDCSGAQTLTICSAPVTGDMYTATESTPSACVASSFYWFDLWYKFVADATTATIKVVGSSGFDAVVELSDACGGTVLNCRDNTGDGGTETINATGLIVGNTYYIRVYPYDDGYYSYPTTFTFTVAVSKPGYWTGATSTDWNTASNWCDNTVPTTTVNVTIPDQANDPIVGAYTANCANFTILSGATFGFTGGVASSNLIINGAAPVITTNGNTFSGSGVLQIGAGSSIATILGGATFNNDRITISANSTLKLNGSADFNIGRALRVNSGANVYSFGSNNTGNYPSTPNATAYLNFTDDGINNGIIDYNTGTANGFISGQVKTNRKIAASNTGYRYISTPVQGTISQWADDFTITGADGFVHTGTAYTNPWPTLWQYDESNTNPNMAYGWVSNTNTSNVLDRATGYAAITPGGITLDLTGPLQVPTGIAAGTISKAVTSTSSGQPLSDGWNLIGNPYQSPLNFVSLRSGNSTLVAAYAYYWVSNGTYSGTYGSYNALTGISANGGTQFVAPHQGFMVRANSNGNVSFNNSMTGNTTAYAFLKSDGPSPDMPILRLSVKENGMISDEVVVASLEEAAENVSNDPYDTDKFFNNEDAKPEVYLTESQNSGNKLAVSTLPEITDNTVVPIGVSHIGVFNTVVTEMANIPSGIKVYLEDKKLNQFIELNLGNSVSLTKTEGEASEGRYFLRFGNESGSVSAEDASMIGYSYVDNGQIQIKLIDAGINPSIAKMIDISGKLIGTFPLYNNNGINTISNINLAPGIYLIDVKTDKGSFVNKVVFSTN